MAKPGSFALIFPRCHSLPLPPLLRSLWGFFSLLDGAEAEPQTNFSHSRNEAWRAQFVSLQGNRIHSSVPQKTPFFQTERELFVWWQLQLSSCSSCDSFKSKSSVAVLHFGKRWHVVHIIGKLCHHVWRCLYVTIKLYIECLLTKLPNDSKLSVW